MIAEAAGLTASRVARGSAAASKRHGFVVVGRGPMGAAAVRHLATAGEDVVVVGPEEPEDWSQHEGAFASHYDEGRQFELASSEEVLVRLAKDSVRGFQEVEKATGISFFRRHPNLRVGPAGFSDDHYYNWDGIDAVGRELGVETVHLDDQGLSDEFPQFRFESGSRGLVEPNGGVINPRRMVKAQLRAAEANGATVIRDEVVALNRRSGDIEVVLKNGKAISADQVLIATGAFTNAAKLLERRLAMYLYGVTAVLVEVRGESRPELPTVTCRFGSEEKSPVCFAMPPLQYPDGRWYIKGATASSVDSPIAGDSGIGPWFRGKGVEEDPKLVVGMLRKLLPGFEPRKAHALPCMVSYTPTGNPYIERIDDRVGIAVGGNAWGVMTSDEIGRMAAEMMRDVPWSGPLSAELFKARFA
ncbi:MAG: FAD-dependent oxidoreductase [Myxococcales bacterium]